MEGNNETKFSRFAEATCREMMYNTEDDEQILILTRRLYEFANLLVRALGWKYSERIVDDLPEIRAAITDRPGKIYNNEGVWLGDE